jgi:diguanylate cyclase (GGDEF)-like protein
MNDSQTTTCLTHLSKLIKKDTDASDACLVRIYPHSVGEGIINLAQEEIIIGRDKECQIELDDTSVSRQHASINFGSTGYHIQDLGSVNSTFLNDKKIEEAVLSSGDLLRIGHTIFKFLSSDHVEKQYHEEIYSMMITDGLTHIPNKRYFLEILDREFNRSRRHQRPLSLIMFDIDHFKKINDTHGHLAGDFILRDLCQRVSPFIRKDEVFARYGGEEFAIIVPEGNRNQAHALCDKVLQCINESYFVVENLNIPVTISMGIEQMDNDHHISMNDLITATDKKLYMAKESGRNCIIS